MKLNQNPVTNFLEHSSESRSANQMMIPAEQAQQKPTNVLVNNCFFKNDNKVLSPNIFTKKIPGIKMEDKITAPIMLLESMLALVTKFYYKSEFQIEEFLENVFASFYNQKEFLENKKKSSAPGRKSKRLRKTKNGVLSNAGGDGKHDEKNSVALHDGNHLLDYLVSPLKSDLCVGILNRKLDIKRTCDFRMRDVPLWEEV